MAGGRLPGTWDRSPGGWRPPTSGIYCGQVRGWGLKDLLWGAKTHPVSSMSVCPSLPKRHRWVPTFAVSSLTAQESKTTASDPLVPKPEGACQSRGASSKEAAIPAGMAPLCINMGDTKQIYCCQLRGAQRDDWLPMLLYAPMCTGPIWAWSYHVHPAQPLSLTPMPSDIMASSHIPGSFNPV